MAAGFTDLAMACHLAEQAVRAARSLGNDRLLIRAIAELCTTCCLAGEPEAGLPFGQESVERARQFGDDVLLAVSLVNYLPTLGPTRSLPLADEAIVCTERSGDQLTNFYLHNNACWDALSIGAVPAARAHLEAAARAGQAIGLQDVVAELNLGVVLLEEGDLDGARSSLEAALRISRRNGDNRSIAEAVLLLTCLAGDSGDWSRAALLHGAAQAVQDRTGVPWDELDARYRRDGLDQARTRLGDEQLQEACARGMRLSFDQAFDLAFGTPRPE